MAISHQEEREQFFSALYQLDHLSDEEDVPVSTTAPLQHRPASSVASENVPSQRSIAPIISTQALPQERSSATPIVADDEPPQKAIERKRRPATASISPPPLSSNSRKSKKSAKSRCIPEAKQIFRGSTFYFIPNNNVAGPRKLRIQRALEYGAIWERVWSALVTHVIVDSNLTMSDVLKHFRLEKLPVSVVLVQS
jgi:DNA polymerase IV